MANPKPVLVKHTEYPRPKDIESRVSDNVSIEVNEADDNTDSKVHSAVEGATTILIPEEGEIKAERKLEGKSQITHVDQFAIEDHLKSTDKNPSKEATNCVPFLVRKAHSYEVLPRPFRSTNQFICVSYISVLCCCFFGAIATNRAWKVKLQRNRGLYGAAKESAKSAMRWMITAFTFGLVIGIINLLLYLLGAFDPD